ncbi:tetratricopeptide repeat protein [Halioxenophilus sp. WMMB6]|uniref:tetratricopeptide repeat protein n=1 Tax=Halioxenophilus sp. WMMB6 TaxID=3073815 RepID=UPI00295F494D|nr:tetratricopeptide repeat protein [Halioxenophilus sp. WMMB6]
MRLFFKHSIIFSFWCALVAFISVASHADVPVNAETKTETNTKNHYVGSQSCAGCHQGEFESWHQSDHAAAMAVADSNSVLGNFDNSTYDYAGKTSTFFIRNNEYWVNTEGPDGKLSDFKISYTLGYKPLQQYVIAFPNGHYQVLGIAWDTRPGEKGGQRWFHLYPGQAVDSENPLHWTGPYQKWNSRCASCHVTGWSKNFDPDSNQYQSQWQETGVGCEACHGPGAQHITLAAGGFEGVDNKSIISVPDLGSHWRFDGNSPIARNESTASDQNKELDLCFGCHSRRGAMAPHQPGDNFLDSYSLELLGQGLYHADGQIEDEVFVAGSFLQSAMHQAGVVCSDCHNVHSGKLKADLNGTCFQCHSAPLFGVQSHHKHKDGSAAAQCVSCHMPETTYMVVDPRRDHSIRIPDPALSQLTGTPNACNSCHSDKTPAWAADAVERWSQEKEVSAGLTRGVSVYRDLARSRGHDLLARTKQQQLLKDSQAPGIIRASVLEQWLPTQQQDVLILNRLLTSDDPLVRGAACRNYSGLPVEMRKEALWPLLDDAVRWVRLEAFRALSDVNVNGLNFVQKQQFSKARQAYFEAQKVSADMAQSWMNLAAVHLNQQELAEAEKAYRKALELEPDFIPAWLNMADLYRATNRDWLAKGLLQTALTKAPDDGGAHFSMAMLLIRQKQYQQGIDELSAAVKLEPTNGHYAYVFTVALYDTGKKDEAIRFAERVVDGLDSSLPLLEFLRDHYLRVGNLERAQDLQSQIEAARG